MPLGPEEREVVEELFKAMQRGPDGEVSMMQLFADDAVFIEPFTGVARTHIGKAAIREAFRSTWDEPLPDMQLILDRADVDGDGVRAEWTCTSSAFPVPMKGHDLFTIRKGRIARLEIVVTQGPGGAP